MQEQFAAVCEDLEAQGYRRNDCALAGPLGLALSFLLALPFVGAVTGLHQYVNAGRVQAQIPREIGFWIAVLAVALASALAHELVHGLAWSVASKQGPRAVGFGKQGCWCKVPLSKGAYLSGLLSPIAVLGMLTVAVMLLWPGTLTLLFVFINIMACGSDLLLAICLAGEKGSIIVDDPGQTGYAAFCSKDKA